MKVGSECQVRQGGKPRDEDELSRLRASKLGREGKEGRDFEKGKESRQRESNFASVENRVKATRSFSTLRHRPIHPSFITHLL